MHIEILDLVLLAAAVVAASAVATIGALGLLVWLAGCRLDQRKDRKTA